MHSSSLLFLSNLFSSDMLIILFVGLLLFGGDKLPEIARGLGKGIRDFKDASEGVKREINEQINNFDKKAEEKKTEAAVIAHQEAAENPAPVAAEVTESPAAAKIRPVENTIPVRDEYTAEVVNQTADSHAETNTELVTENHSDVPHTNTGTTTV